MTEEERKRRGLQLTDEYERYVQDVLSARAAGLAEPRPITRVDTESGPEYRTLQKFVQFVLGYHGSNLDVIRWGLRRNSVPIFRCMAFGPISVNIS